MQQSGSELNEEVDEGNRRKRDTTEHVQDSDNEILKDLTERTSLKFHGLHNDILTGEELPDKNRESAIESTEDVMNNRGATIESERDVLGQQQTDKKDDEPSLGFGPVLTEISILETNVNSSAVLAELVDIAIGMIRTLIVFFSLQENALQSPEPLNVTSAHGLP